MNFKTILIQSYKSNEQIFFDILAVKIVKKYFAEKLFEAWWQFTLCNATTVYITRRTSKPVSINISKAAYLFYFVKRNMFRMHFLDSQIRGFAHRHSIRLIPAARPEKGSAACIVANQRRRARFAIRDSDPCMRNALMGNTCYVVTTVTVADWRMTIGFRALLMAVCRRPSPSRSLIQAQVYDLGLLRLPPPFDIGCPPFPGRVRRLRRQIIYGISFFRALISSASTRSDVDRERDFISGAHRGDRSPRDNFAI